MHLSCRNAAHGFSLIQVDSMKVTMKDILQKALKRKGSQRDSGGLFIVFSRGQGVFSMSIFYISFLTVANVAQVLGGLCPSPTHSSSVHRSVFSTLAQS